MMFLIVHEAVGKWDSSGLSDNSFTRPLAVLQEGVAPDVSTHAWSIHHE